MSLIMSASSFYVVLGLESNATIQEIKSAYKRLALIYHPDKISGNNETHTHTQHNMTEFCKIKEAYEVLSDPVKRKIYDDQCKNSSNVNNVIISSEWINQILGNMLILGSRPKDIVIEISVPFKDVYQRKGKRVELKVKRWINSKLQIYTELVVFSLVALKTQIVFKNRGDDGYLPNLHPRSDIIINISIVDYNHQDVRIDSLFSPMDLFVDRKISLNEFYTSATIPIELCDGVTIDVPNDRLLSYCLKNVGLPNGPDARSDLYVNLTLDVPLTLRVEGRHSLTKCLAKYFK